MSKNNTKDQLIEQYKKTIDELLAKVKSLEKELKKKRWYYGVPYISRISW